MTPLFRKITLRLVPFLMLLYMVAFLDRVNISFAALTMNRDLGISESFYGFAAGVFFVSYCLCEVPANLLLIRVGARRWLALLLVAWGAISVGTAFVDGRVQYIAARSLLGVAESGFFPGVIFYLTLWLPRHMRARIIALFLVSLSICNTVGSPISSHILLMDGASGLKGWQWLFILEGVPAILLGVITWFVLADGPASAAWLSPEEKSSLAGQLLADEAAGRVVESGATAHVARDSLAYFMLQTGIYGLTFWLPKILASEGVSIVNTGWWAAIPYGAAAVAMVAISRTAGRWWLAIAYLAGAAGFVAAPLFHNLGASVAAFSVAAMGMYAALPLFWSASTGRMSGKVAGAAIATVNAIGVTGGFVGPYVMGWLHDATHSYFAGLWVIAAGLVVGALIIGASPTHSSPPAR
jgi:MFS transporter, ACS family, tartrate transporter